MKNILAPALAACAFTLSAQQVMTPELLWDLSRVSLETVSPDGKNFIYGVSQYNTEDNSSNRDLYLMGTDGKSKKQLTDMEGSEYGATYLMDGKKIGFSHKGQFHIMNADGTERKQLTNIEGGISNINAYDLPDGRIALVFSKSVKLEKTTADLYPDYTKAEAVVIDNLMYRHWDSWSDADYNHVCIAYANEGDENITEHQDLMEGEKFDAPVNPFGGGESYSLSPDGKSVVYEAKKLSGKDWAQSTNSELYMVDLSTGKTTNITEGMEGYDKEPKFSPDGSKLAWMSMKTPGYESDVNDIIIMNVATGEKTHLLQATNKYDEMTFQSFAWKDNNNIFAGVPTNGSNHVYQITYSSKGVDYKKVTKGDFNYNHFEIAGRSLIVDRQDMNHATEVYNVSLKKGEAKQLTHENDEIYSTLSTSKVEKRMVKTSDGKDMLTWVIYPPDFDPNKKYPTLLYCQGGPQSQVSQFYSFRWNFQLMAANGYIVVAPNRRGLPGFGKEWNEEISGDWGGQAMKDYLAAIDDVSKESYVDESKLGAVGASYGGYSVYYLAGNHDKRFSAFISHCGLFDLENWYLTTEELFFANQDLGGPFWMPENKETYSKFDPKDYVQNWDTPILVIHGGKDFRVPEAQGMAAFQAAQLRGVPSKFLYFPNEGHWVLNPQNGLIWHDQFFGWLDQWLKD
ncbi:dipeptidyl aminopeptidase/acylaminoacyl peptidase [Owenweeksia hongkongensis DSM 17368]|uniref:Dipeptidyl aminopeptidase/acylaminoacyl peptidase n=1 Tax=Owenweeksia hongkongensis (strain DSM 17368 / CIP 108786 / JCM 12287 / NRRL B-23963 / UST20020801) TaxID=926562 RepID=G8R201_OWEHD|nr:S9 family peptidase [Owenweeksia hongkongensis]AEV33951.1 dipeptidyl aminopeptidase/acylaminoacyl peptidase [Owenweeksia hongkongensis DSM 17368]